MDTINAHVCGAAVELRETGTEGVYPLLHGLHPAPRQPAAEVRHLRLLTKPDVRFLSSFDNDIQIMGDPDNALVYDRRVTGDGIRWRDLQNRWQDTHQSPGSVKRSALFRSRW
ncbi:hypothetical protein [Streptomyces xantholiticus]|uniref:hypothetical protein n=1 Tax=Streptomyces xantholiticus TaxID=68285 RepID=UPI0016766486|nr:hypothetical protein [Streptomyces xantholiticus]GGW65075.1 hypothetical protein GCM10010381_57520 [Streptomyces xantholiticus]